MGSSYWLKIVVAGRVVPKNSCRGRETRCRGSQRLKFVLWSLVAEALMRCRVVVVVGVNAAIMLTRPTTLLMLIMMLTRLRC